MKFAERVFPYLLLSPAVLPLVISGGLYFPYLFPKVILFYALLLLTVASFVYLVSCGTPFYFTRLKKWVTWIPAALLVLAYSTSITGIDFYKSFWSIFGRGDGLLMLTLSVASFYLILISADTLFSRRLTRVVASVGTLVAVWGIIEWLITGGRIGSSIGNAAFLAGYLALSFFVTLVVAHETPAWRRSAYVGAALQFFAILLTATRGTVLALIGAVVLSLVYITYAGSGRLRRSAMGGLIVLAVVMGGFFMFRSSLAHSALTPVARIAQISFADPDIANRLFVWKNMVNEIAQRPVFGYGAEHIAYLFDRFYDPGVITEEWFDRSHNAYLDYAAQFGIGGALLYLALILSFIFGAWRYSKRDRTAGLLLALAGVVYAAQNFFLFDTISSWWLFVALLAVVLARDDGESSPKFLSLPRMPWVGLGLGGVLILLIIPVSILPLIANYDLTRGYYYQVVDVARANAYFKNGLALKTYGTLEYGYQLHTMYTEQQVVRLAGADRVAAYEMAKSVLMQNYQDFPYDARTAVYLAHVLDAAPPEEPVDPTLVTEVVHRALLLSPKRAQSWYVLANLSIGSAKDLPVGPQKTARYQIAVQTLEQYVALVPSLSEPHYVLADLYWAIGNLPKAEEEAALGNTNYHEDLATARRAALFYERVHDWEHAAFYLKSVVMLDPTDDSYRFDLAKVLFLLGDRAGSEQVVQELRTRNPDILSTDPSFLAAITAYEQSLK